MPRRIRDFKAELRLLGFMEREGKGSHTNWKHPQLQALITIAFRDGADVPRYLEKLLQAAKDELASQLKAEELEGAEETEEDE